MVRKFVGVDIGGTSIKMGVISEIGEILQEDNISTNSEEGADAIVSRIAEFIPTLVKEAKLAMSDISGIGIGCPGSIDSHSGVVTYNNNMGWKNVHIIRDLKAKLGDMPMFISNDANVAALGEATFGAGKKYGDSVLVTLGTGVGGGIVIWDKMFEGNKSAGAEIGHMVIEVGGEQCTCGRKGCFEAYSSATALIRDTKRKMESRKDSMMWEMAKTLDDVDGRTAFECAKKGDAAAQEVVDRYIKYLGEGIVNIVNVLRPEVVMIGGGVSAQGDNLIIPLQKYIDENVYGGNNWAKALIAQANLGNRAGIIGAGTLAMKNIDNK